MKKRLFFIIMFISVVASIASIVITIFIYHKFYVNEAINQLKNIIPMLIFLYMGLLIIVYIVAGLFTKSILKPLKGMIKSLDEMLDDDKDQTLTLYEEFDSLAHKILEQKVKINQYIEELKYERDTINIITENMKEGFILINKNKHILSINSSGKRMIGNNKFNLKDNRNIIELTRNNEILQRINTSINENKHIVYDMDTNHNHYRYYLSPVKEHKKSSVAGLLILIEDVTIQKNAEIMRSEFSANVSHELKTPLTTMIGFAEVIKEGLITDLDSIQKYCGMIHKEGLRLISLIEDIIRLSKIEEGIEYSNSSINLREKAKEVISLLQSKAETLNIKLYLHADNVTMVANENYISELLYNLIDNGIKYNNKDGGFVSVSIYKSEKYIIIKVKDNGVGISDEHQDRIFERFYRADKSRSKDTGGTGLGLSIVKHIIELYDGSVELKSQQFKGTEIMIKFPIN